MFGRERFAPDSDSRPLLEGATAATISELLTSSTMAKLRELLNSAGWREFVLLFAVGTHMRQHLDIRQRDGLGARW